MYQRMIGSYIIGALDYSDTSNGGQFLQVISVSQTIQHPLYGDPNYPQESFDFRLNLLFQSSIIDPVDIDSENISDAYRSGKVNLCFIVVFSSFSKYLI